MEKELELIFKADQKDRQTAGKSGDCSEMMKNDKVRKKRVLQLLKNEIPKTGRSNYLLGFLFHHGGSKIDRVRAIRFAKKSMELGYKKAKWLYAAAVDRKLLDDGKKQKFGTQYKILKNGKWKLQSFEKSTTDEERMKYDVPTLVEAKKINANTSKK